MATFWAKYALAAHLSLLTVAPLFLYPLFGSVVAAQTTLWLTLWAALWMLGGPSQRNDETLYDARVRVRRTVIRDPLLYLALAVAALAAVRWLNGGIVRAYEVEAGKWFLTLPKVSVLPGSARGAGLEEFSAALAGVLLLTACRNALGKTARVATVAFGALLSGLCGFVDLLLVANGLIDSSSWPVLGYGFGVGMVVSAISLAGVFACYWNRYLVFHALAMGGNAVGLALFAPVPVVWTFLAAAVLCAIASIVWLLVTRERTDALKYGVMIVAAGAACVFAPLGALSRQEFIERSATLARPLTVPDGFGAMRSYHAKLAREVWREHPWIGAGLGAYPLEFELRATGEPRRECLRRLGSEQWALFRPRCGSLPDNPLNAWWLILCEQGIVGLAGVGVLVMATAFSLIGRAVRTRARNIFWPLPVAAAVLAATVVGLMLADAGAASAPALLPVVAAVACAAGAFPPPRREDGDGMPVAGGQIETKQDKVE